MSRTILTCLLAFILVISATSVCEQMLAHAGMSAQWDPVSAGWFSTHEGTYMDESALDEGHVLWRASESSKGYPAGQMAFPQSLGRGVTVTTQFSFAPSTGEHKIWLAGLATNPFGPPNALSLVISGEAHSWFGFFGSLCLESAASTDSPIPQSTRVSMGVDPIVGNVYSLPLSESVHMDPYEVYGATLSYDGLTGLTSVEVVSLADGQAIYCGHLYLEPVTEQLYPTLGALQVAGPPDREWQLEFSAVQATAGAERLGLPIALQGRLDLKLNDAEENRRHATGVGQVYTDETPTFVIDGIEKGLPPLPGELRVVMRSADGEPQQSWQVPFSRALDSEFMVSGLSSGRYSILLEYIEPDYHVELVEREMELIKARMNAMVRFPHNEAWTTGGMMEGEISLQADRDIFDVHVHLEASPENDPSAVQLVWERTVSLSKDERQTFPVAFETGEASSPFIFAFGHVASELVDASVSFHVPRTYYVSPEGDDNWTGNRADLLRTSGSGSANEPEASFVEGPFRTIGRAQQAIRDLKASSAWQGPVTVLLRGGTYRLSTPVVMTPDDSGQEGAPITYAAFPGESPVISGGLAITAWTQRDDELWSAQVPEIVRQRYPVRTLRVGESWATRARHPNFDPGHPITGGWLFSQSMAEGNYDRLVLAPEEFPVWSNWRGAEVHIFPAWGWVNAILDVKEVSPEQQTLVVASEQDIRPGNRFFIANTREALDAPGEWFLDPEEQELVYWPEDSAFPELEVVLSITKELIRLEGSSAQNQFVEHIHFRGLTFADTDYSAPGGYYVPADAAIRLRAARHIVIQDSVFTNLGGYAVRLEERSHGNELVRNEMRQLGQGGLSC